jgi:hypothetical protein
MEQWKPIPGYEGYYEASTLGVIRSVERVVPHGRHGTCKQKSKVLKYAFDNKGYIRVALSMGDSFKTYTIHRLIAMTFLGERPEGYQINHRSGIKTDNSVDNLEYCTHAENVSHSVRMGLQKPRKGVLNGMAILTDQAVKEIRFYVANCGKRYYGREELAKKYGVSSAHIKDIVSGRRGVWSHV